MLTYVLWGQLRIASFGCGNLAAPCPRATDLEPVRAIFSPWLWGRLTPGPHAVGLTVIAGVDSTRTESRTGGDAVLRPLELVVWYPARATDSGAAADAAVAAAGARTTGSLTHDTLRFVDYVDLSEPALSRGPERDARRQAWLASAVSRDPSSVPPALVRRVLATTMAAVREATPLGARAPVVLWSARHATPAAQSVLSEYLASHGYVVAWARYTGTDSLRPPYDDLAAPRRREILEAHVADMQWALGRVATFPGADSTRLAVAAWSYSGEPATVLVQRMPRVRVLLSLSAGIFTSTYRRIDLQASIDSQPLRSDVLVLEESSTPHGPPRTPPPILDRLPGKVYRVAFDSLAHGDFNALEGMIPGLTGISAVHPWSIGGAVAQSGYETIARATLALLDHTMKGAAGPVTARLEWPGVALVRHGPGRSASATAGTAFLDRRVVIASGEWQLVGNFTSPPARTRVPVVLMLNKANGDRRVYRELARELAHLGIASLRLDLRGHGESTNVASFVPGLANAAIGGEDDDVMAALRWIGSQQAVDVARLGVVGASYSGEAMAVAARRGATADAYVALSPGSLSAETIDGIDPSGVPWWILRSRDERFVRDVVEAARARSRAARVTEVDGAAHASDMLVTHPELARAIARWLATALRR